MIRTLKTCCFAILVAAFASLETLASANLREIVSWQIDNLDGIDPIITGPVDPKRMPKITAIDIKCDADCQAKKIGLTFDE